MAGFLRRNAGRILWGAVKEWHEDKVPRLAAALAFYTIFALTPLVLVAQAITVLFADPERPLKDFKEQVAILAGPKGAELIDFLHLSIDLRHGSPWASLIGLAVMLYAASAAFTELKDALDTIWQVQPKSGLNVWSMVRAHFLSFALMLVIAFFLLVSLIMTTIITAVSRSLSLLLSQTLMIVVVSFIVVTLLFALIYKILPDVQVRWRDVWFGAATAAFLFAVGKVLFGWYLGHSSIGTTYGAAASLVIVVLWTYYSSLILLFGAEITQVQTLLRGVKATPTADAIPLTDHDRLQQGIPRDDQVEQCREEQEDASEQRKI